jgi:cobalt-precorrin-5B (C1)-methyltransferase
VTARGRADIAADVQQSPPLRRGWTTGACATAAAKAAFTALLTGDFPDPVAITLPRGEHPAFALAETKRGADYATAGIVKDAGDDPDVTHGALVCATVRLGSPGSGFVFRAGPGVGTVTKPGLPIPPGEPAINPAPRAMIRAAIAEVAAGLGHPADAIVEISIADGEALAAKTLNPRLGIVGGLSVLGTTGVVVPYSCAAWIAGIRQGIDVARAAALVHVAGATGRTSEAAVQQLYHLPEAALIDMGDYVGSMLKYLRARPIPRLTVAGGVAKLTKLAQGRLDLHQKRGSVDADALAAVAAALGAPAPVLDAIKAANTTAEAFSHAAAADIPLGDAIAAAAWRTCAQVLGGADIALEIIMVDREGAFVGRAPFRPVHGSASRNRRR